MAEETTLEEMERLKRAKNEARRALESAEEKIKALSEGSRANIDGVRACLSTDGDVFLALEDNPELEAFRLTACQFFGLMGWGRKHVGNGPNSKTPK